MPCLKHRLSKLSLLGRSNKGNNVDQAVDEASLVRKVKATFSIFLCDLLNELEGHRVESHEFDLNLAAGLAITIESFDPYEQSPCRESAENTHFFSPVALETFQEYERDLEQAGAKDLAERLGECYEPDPQEWPQVCYHNAGELCSSLSIVLDGLPYKKGTQKLSSLSDVTSWKKIEQFKAFSDPRGFDASECWDDEWRSQPQSVWAATDKPHMMACMSHHYAHNDDILFVSEIEVMVALMIVRLANDSFPSLNIVPVMLFSYTGDKRGRILQAYMNAQSLVIRKSDFFDFRPRVDAHLDLFTRYMMGPLQGKTLILDPPHIKSNCAEKVYTVDRLQAAGIIR